LIDGRRSRPSWGEGRVLGLPGHARVALSMSTTELFATFDEDGRPAGLVPRDRVHRLGLWHRAANVFLFSGAGEVLMQQRAVGKDVAPGAWDLSAAEHLRPDESFADGAARGVAEELGLLVNVARFRPMGEPFRFEHRVGEVVWDREIQQCFAARWTGAEAPRPDPVEVQAVRWVAWTTLRAGPTTGEVWTAWLLEGLRRGRAALDAFAAGR